MKVPNETTVLQKSSYDPQPVTQALVARQPICGLNQRTYGYELLFRRSGEAHAVIENGEQATAHVIINSFMEIGLDRLVGDALAFINVTRDFVVGDHCRALPRERVVLEILEDTIPGEAILRVMSEMRTAGYTFAMDDYAFQDSLRPLLSLCDIVKVDLRAADSRLYRDEIAELQNLGKKLIAEKVETREEFEFCKQLGFGYFQGYYFCRPDVVSGSKTPVNRISIYRLIAKLQDPDLDPREIEELIEYDLGLSYKLLRYINSAYLALSNRIESVGHAVRLVGTEHIRLLASLFMLTSMNDKPRELMVMSLMRAKMCEMLASQTGFKRKEAFFTVGLFSTLDAFLDCTMEDALKLLPLSNEIHTALLEQRGAMGQILKCVIAYEQASWEGMGLVQMDPSMIRSAYVHSLDWGRQLLNSVG